MTPSSWPDQPGLVTLPGGATVRGRRLRAEVSPADFALVLATGPPPPWPHRRVRWPDFWVPLDRADALDALTEALHRAHGGERVEVTCAVAAPLDQPAASAAGAAVGLGSPRWTSCGRRTWSPRSTATSPCHWTTTASLCTPHVRTARSG